MLRRFIMILAICVTNGVVAHCIPVKIKVSDKVSVEFPRQPNIDSKPEKRLKLYVSKNSLTDCIFSALVKHNAIEDYDKIKHLSTKERQEAINEYLEKGITDFVVKSEIIEPSKSFYIAGYLGKELMYKEIDNGKASFKFSKFLLVDNTLYLFQCTMDEEDNCSKEKDEFLNSVLILSERSKNTGDAKKEKAVPVDFFNDAPVSSTDIFANSPHENQRSGNLVAEGFDANTGASYVGQDPAVLKEIARKVQPFSEKIIRVFEKCDATTIELLCGWVLVVSFLGVINIRKIHF